MERTDVKSAKPLEFMVTQRLGMTLRFNIQQAHATLTLRQPPQTRMLCLT